MPKALRQPLSPSEWRKLSDDERLAHATVRITEQVAEDQAAYAAERAKGIVDAEFAARVTHAPRTSPPVSPVAVTEPATSTAVSVVVKPRPALPPRYVVSCAGECGRMLPARDGRPVVAYCGQRAEVRAELAPGNRPCLPRPRRKPRPAPTD